MRVCVRVCACVCACVCVCVWQDQNTEVESARAYLQDERDRYRHMLDEAHERFNFEYGAI